MSVAAASAHYFLGVDGGGTGCRARIEDEAGTVLGQGLSGPATTRLGIGAAWASVAKAFDAAIEEAGFGPAEIARIRAGIGLAGIGRKGALEAFRAIAHPFASIDFVSDGVGACLGAHSGQDGAIVMQRFKDDPIEAVAWMDRATATDYAAFAPMVIRHADQGDPVGRRIVQGAAEQVDTFVRVLFEKGAPRVTLLGGLSSPLEPWLAPDVRRRLKPADGDAVSGAIILAKK
ncbi:MAG: N-acetylglucosamine kinase, partial [Mesorhizobium sp.]